MDSGINKSIAIYFIIFFISMLCIAKPVYIPAITVSGGENHTLILTESNSVWSCGDNTYSQLGDNTNKTRFVPVQVLDGEMNTDSNYLENITVISAGWMHSLAVDSNRFCWSWGSDGAGQLGNGDSEGSSAVPVQVHGGEQGTPFLRYITCISAGRSGAHSLAVDANHFCYAWGNNNMGQCGDSYTINRQTPVKVRGGQMGTPNLRYIVAVSAGEEQSMALDANGFVYTFGDNFCGKLGINNSQLDKSTTPVKVFAGQQDPSHSTTANLKNIVAISVGWDHCMALEKRDSNYPNDCQGRVYTWGFNRKSFYGSDGGRLGNGTIQDACMPVFVKAGEQNPGNPNAALQNIVAIGAGESHCIALDSSGYVWSWGDNYYGQLGNGTNDPCYVPVKVVGFNGVGYLKDIVYISAGYWHNLAVDKSGAIWVWGKGGYDALGTGSGDDVTTPIPIHIYELNVYNKTQHNKCYKRIKPAIDEANSNDVIELNEGYFCEDVNLGNKSIILRSRDPNNLSVVNNTRIYGSDGSKIINLKTNTGSVINGLTLIDGSYGIYSDSSNPLISHCRIQDNQTNGIYISGGNATTIINNLIFHNHCTGIYLNNCSSSSEIRNNTIVDNYSYSSYGIQRGDSVTNPIIKSNIIYNNGSGAGGAIASGITNVHYNCLPSLNSGYYSSDNTVGDPLFVDEAGYNFHLRYNSPCIDKGDPYGSYTGKVDIDGEARVNGSYVDIGADEFYSCTNKDVFPLPPDGPDGIVNFQDFVVLASAWMFASGNSNFNDAVDFINDDMINRKDLKEFCYCWLYKTANYEYHLQVQDEYMLPEDESSLMQSEPQPDEQMAESQQSPSESEGSQQQQSYLPDYNLPAIYLTCDNNTPEPNDEVTIYVHSAAPLFAMGLGIYISGDANITTAMSEADCNNFGWDNGWNSDPYIDPNGWVYLSGVKWAADVNGTVSYVKFRYHSGQVSVYIDPEWSLAFTFDWDNQISSLVPFSQEVLYISRD